MRLTSFLENKRLTIALKGEIDHHCAKNYIESISSKIEAYNPEECILDFSDVDFMDSSGIAVVINGMRNMNRAGGRIVLSKVKNQPLKVLRASGVDKLIEIRED